MGRIGRGLCVLVGVAKDDVDRDADVLARKVVELRLFEDAAGKLERSLSDVGGALLVVPEFTLYADCRRGRRPSFAAAAPAPAAAALYERFVAQARSAAVPVETGRFRAHMAVALVNDGPVTVVLDSRLV